VVHRKAEGRFQHLFAVQAGAEAQEEPRDAREQLPRQLDTAARDEEVHDRQVIGVPAHGEQRLGARLHEAHAVALPPQHECERAAGAGVGVDEKDVSVAHDPALPKARDVPC
jgi:hypothetical protein